MPDLIDKGTLRIAICDDNPLALEQLKILVARTLSSEWNLTLTCDTSPQNLLTNSALIQIVILDIQLPDCSGIDVARVLTAKNPHCCVIFVSGFPCYVSDVYDVPHMCLVLKNQLQTQLPKFLLRAAAEVTAQAEQILTVRTKGEPLRLTVADICFMERREHITFIYLKSGLCVQTREKLDALLTRISSWKLCRCHISFVVNLPWVETMRGRDFIMRSGVRVPISRVNMQAAKAAFFRYLRETT